LILSIDCIDLKNVKKESNKRLKNVRNVTKIFKNVNEKHHQQYAAECICMTCLSPKNIEITAIIISQVNSFKNDIISVIISKKNNFNIYCCCS